MPSKRREPPTPPMRQTAPYPVALREMVAELSYKPEWVFDLVDIDRGRGCMGLTLTVCIVPNEAQRAAGKKIAMHSLPVPAEPYDRRAWRRWLLRAVLLIERHDACEAFAINGERVFAPEQDPRYNPYDIVEVGTFYNADATVGGML